MCKVWKAMLAAIHASRWGQIYASGGSEIINISNTASATVCINKSFRDIMGGTISYGGASELQYGVKVMQARMKGIIDDLMPLN